jgi:hypothetical protein
MVGRFFFFLFVTEIALMIKLCFLCYCVTFPLLLPYMLFVKRVIFFGLETNFLFRMSSKFLNQLHAAVMGCAVSCNLSSWNVDCFVCDIACHT